MTVQKFAMFDDLKSIETRTLGTHDLIMKKHGDFEKVILDIRLARVQQDKLSELKQ